MEKESLGKPSKKVFIVENKRSFWYRLTTGSIRDSVTLSEDCYPYDILEAIYIKHKHMFQSIYHIDKYPLLSLKHNGKELDKSQIIMAASAAQTYSIEQPAEIYWEIPQAEKDSMALYKILQSPDRSPPHEMLKKCADGSLLGALKSAIASGKYGVFLDQKEIGRIAHELKQVMTVEPIVFASEAAVVACIYLVIKHALHSDYPNEHIKHIRIQHEYPIVHIFAEDKIAKRADLAVHDIYEPVPLLITEAKMSLFQTLIDAIQQNIDQLRLYTADKHPSKIYGIASTYDEWVIIEYEYNSGEGEKIKMSNIIGIGKFQHESEGELQTLITMIRAAICLAFDAQKITFT